MSLPVAVANAEWAQTGGNAGKSGGHVELGQALGVLMVLDEYAQCLERGLVVEFNLTILQIAGATLRRSLLLASHGVKLARPAQRTLEANLA